MRSLIPTLALAALAACSPASSSADSGAVQPSPLAAPAPRPAAAPACGADAYRHPSPAFCVNLPAELRGKAPEVRPDGIVFQGDHQSVAVQWAPLSDTKRIAAWKSLEPGPDRVGTFEVLSVETLPRGAFSLVHDATQHRVLEIYKVPDLHGATVVEDATHAFHCTARINLERPADGRTVAAERAAFLSACKSFHLG